MHDDLYQKVVNESIPAAAAEGQTRLWVLGESRFATLNSADAEKLLKLGYKVEMCIDQDCIAYVTW